MFCDNCGKQINEGDAFCNECGTPVKQSNPEVNEPASYTTNEFSTQQQPVAFTNPAEAPAKKQLNKKTIIGIIAAIVVVIAGYFIYNNFFGANSSPEKVVETVVSAVNKGDVDKYLKIYPKEMRNAIKNDSYFEDITEELADIKEESDSKISYKISDKTKVKKSEYDDIYEYLESFNESFDTDLEYTIEDAYELEVEFKFDDDTDTDTITVVKIDGSWYTFENVL